MDALNVCKTNLQSYAKSGHEVNWYGGSVEQSTYRKAAVLIPLFIKNNNVHILLTRRSDKVKTHKGQISFPGGKMEDKDADIIETALRETHEEIGIAMDDVEVVSTWTPLIAKGGKDSFLAVYPVVGILKPDFQASTNDEVSEVFGVPLEFFLLEESHRQHHYHHGNTTLPIHYFSYEQGESTYYVWGITGNLCLKLAIVALRKLPMFELKTEVEQQDYHGFVNGNLKSHFGIL
ncbi:Peroxisomal coenzyme A diphosphatase NUDT7 [Exaiptasia diaphana]|nr:Peroxisomal coenzyme A diphosphatase NUDT7 [Exaiptasia diaphana]